MVHSVLCDGEYYSDVATRHQVTPGMISTLVKKVKKNPDFFDELVRLREEKA